MLADTNEAVLRVWFSCLDQVTSHPTEIEHFRNCRSFISMHFDQHWRFWSAFSDGEVESVRPPGGAQTARRAQEQPLGDALVPQAPGDDDL
jgi:hypothetical protein